jgi:hypothetical protein
MSPNFQFTACIELTDYTKETLYEAKVIHADRRSCQMHASMGFEAGWGKALDQMIEMIQNEM